MLRVIKLNNVKLSVVLLSFVMLNAVILKVIMLNIVMLTVVAAQLWFNWFYSKNGSIDVLLGGAMTVVPVTFDITTNYLKFLSLTK